MEIKKKNKASDHNGIKLETTNRKLTGKLSIYLSKLNNTFPNNPWVKEEV